MSKIVDTEVGQFRQVTDGTNKWFLFECPVCHERLPMDEETLAGRSPIDHIDGPGSKQICAFQGRKELGKVLVATMQARILMGERPHRDEGEAGYAPRRDGVDGPY
jgi:hypothetical protein